MSARSPAGPPIPRAPIRGPGPQAEAAPLLSSARSPRPQPRTHSAGRGTGSAIILDSSSEMSFSFHLRRWTYGNSISPSRRQRAKGSEPQELEASPTCHVPRPKAVTGMRSRNHWRKESSSAFVAGASAAELPHLLGLQARPREFHTGLGSQAPEEHGVQVGVQGGRAHNLQPGASAAPASSPAPCPGPCTWHSVDAY
ncbi:hypothetical protein D623_10007889 [Myotis brandtii]|uniref:Uncharacterized protein n=1 Tax=Myotis brandtii TaxID=109478 RepID=S7N535_MYOBR|nr:hypothetical protein D623_10007889 [Myotis brandtii]